MILEVRLKNIFSIDDEVILDLRSGNLRAAKAKNLEKNLVEIGKTRILKSAVIYGANASGKSNIIKAIRFCCRMILSSHDHNEGVVFNFEPFKFKPNDEPSYFFIRFMLNEVEYEYSFSFKKTEIIKESLHYYPNGKIKKIFTRDESISSDKSEIYSFGTKEIKRPLDVALNTSDKTLYLSRASQMDREVGKTVYNFFNNQFMLGYASLNSEELELLFTQYKDFILEALRVADSDIVNIELKKEKQQSISWDISFNEEQEQSLTKKNKEVDVISFSTYHKFQPEVAFSFEREESEGTKKLFRILLRIIDVIANNKILLIDEIESSLHSKIVEFIFTLFHDAPKSQLICSTHDTNLLNLDLLRKDQIYFANKNEKGSTDLYSLYDFKDFRDNMDLEKGYLQGRFDAIPHLGGANEIIKNLING